MAVKTNSKKENVSKNCSKADLMAVNDALEVLNGRWKLQILISLMAGPKRFKQITNDVTGISDKMLSKELKDLETNLLITRTVFDTFPPTAEYAVTGHTYTLSNLINELKNWGLLHRKKILKK